jgi:hypothetical protein
VTRARLTTILVVIEVAAAVLVALGRWEQRRAVNREAAGMRAVLAAIGGRPDVNTISGYRYGPPNCLSYSADKMVFALQLCFSTDGHLVTAVDRRGPSPVYYSLEYRPSLSPIVFRAASIDVLLRSAQRAAAHG